jgi:hypothetical protein
MLNIPLTLRELSVVQRRYRSVPEVGTGPVIEVVERKPIM